MSGSYWPAAAHPKDLLGRPSRKAATVALKAHLSVVKGKPIRLALSEALADEKSLGGHERRFAAFATRELSRHLRLLDTAAKLLGFVPAEFRLPEDRALVRYTLWRRLFTKASWAQLKAEVALPGPIRPRTFRDDVLEGAATDPLPEPEALADPVEQSALRHSFPNWLAAQLAQEVPADEVDALFAALNVEPDLFLRARPPGAREERIAQLREEGVECEAVAWTQDGLRLTQRGMKVFETQAMKRGLLQVQEPGSQLIAELCRMDGARSAADLCAGAGGKTMALADLLGPGARVFAADASKRRLDEGRRRVREAGLKNVSFPAEVPLSGVDVALIDAPCSGTGSLSREPEQKWKLTKEKVAELSKTQRALLDETAAKLKPGAVLVYATCSLLRAEDEDVVEAFLAAHPDFTLEPALEVLGPRAEGVVRGPYLRVFPHKARSGGFFAARLRKGRG